MPSQQHLFLEFSDILLGSTNGLKLKNAVSVWNQRLELLNKLNKVYDIYNCALDYFFWKLVRNKQFKEANFLFRINPKSIDLSSTKSTPYQNFKEYCSSNNLDTVKFLWALLVEHNLHKNLNKYMYCLFEDALMKENIEMADWLNTLDFEINKVDCIFNTVCKRGLEKSYFYLTKLPYNFIINDKVIVDIFYNSSNKMLYHIIENNNKFINEQCYQNACLCGNLEFAKHLFNLGQNDFKKVENDTFLKKVCVTGHIDVVRWLLC